MIDQVGVADTEDQAALTEAVVGQLARHWPADSRHKQIADPAQVSELPVWAALAEVGLAGLPLAEEQGGAGGRWVDLAVALEAVGAVLAPVPSIGAAAVLGTLQALPGAPASALLGAVAEGTVATFAWTAHEDLWGAPGSVRATAPSPTDAQVTLTGEVSAVLSPEAAHVLVLAEAAGGPQAPDGPLLVAVDAGAAGFDLTRVDGVDATRPLGTLTLHDTPGTVLAAGAEATAAVRRGQATAALALAAECTGLAGHCLTGAVAYAADRHQFGRPIGSFQAIKHRCAEMLAEVEQARAATRHLAARLDDAAADPAELDDALALALLAAGRAAGVVSNEYLQILGGIGFTWEHEVHLYLRRAAAGAPLLGGAGAHRARLDPTRRGTGARPTLSVPDSGPAAELAGHVAALLPAWRERWGDEVSFASRMAWQQALHSVGWVAPQWPVEYGGRGLGIVDQVACDRVMATHRAPQPLGGVLGLNNVAPTLMRYGTPEQKAHLPAIQAGTEIWCQGFSEPGSGSDLASLRTRAELVGDGDDAAFVITGQKVWTSEGMEATHCLLLARTDPDAPAHRGISALLVPLDLPGITRRPITMITGESGFAEVFYDEVRVPRSALLGPLHAGWTVTMTTLGFERAGVIELAAGLEQSVDDLVTALSGHGLDEQTRLELTDRLVEARLVGLLGSRALGRIAEGGAPGAEHSVIKLLWSRAMQHQGETHLAALGLAGVAETTGRRAQREYLMSRSATIAGGTTEIMRNILAERVLGMPR
ncbi:MULTISPECIES: acyl-CoA dehydrogenase [Frankia]|uniref:Acyl-CoA dehydrogenase n=1 Tax=Frankia alni (strain DSM 45986 / CECT 9034 / ACN14a) TaxID=326424 RepID=Q0RJY1_FRAAA|nr:MULTISPECIES: acyl-CoA dehydrogenase [Frankia]CAJ62179.1 putative acyl-CoA dehydrogenase [Frankia alni ACN14a]